MRASRASRRLLAVSFIAVFLVTGCAAGESPPPREAAARSSKEVPDFEGPWSDWFSRIYAADSTTDGQRAVLADGVIDDQEYVALRNDFKACLQDLGVPVTLEADGGYSVGTDGNLNEMQVTGDAVPACERDTVGAVASLYENIRRNPDQEDEFSLMVDCLQRSGVVGDTYTEAQYVSDLDNGTGLEWGSPAVRDCARDPLGILDAEPIIPDSR